MFFTFIALLNIIIKFNINNENDLIQDYISINRNI